MVKEKRILSYFMGWLIVGLCIIFAGINNVFAEEVAYSNVTFRVKECGNNEWSNWTSATQKLSVYSINNLGFRLYFNNTTLNANTYYNIIVTYNFYTEAPSINVMNAYGKSTFYYNTTASETGNIQGNNNNYSVRFEKDTENTNLIKAVYNVLIPVNAKFIAFNINWDEPNKDTCRTLSDGFTISNIKIESLNDTQAIVDGNNANTENIINNNNQNTQDIINNQNQNNEELKDTIKDQFNSCGDKEVIKEFNSSDITENGYYLNSTGNKVSHQYYGIINDFEIKKDTNYTIKKNVVDNSPSYCLYDDNKNLIDCVSYSGNTELTFNSGNAKYISISINNGNTSYIKLIFLEEVCSNKIDETNDKLDNITGALTDSSAPNTSGLENSAGWLPPGPLDSILNLPLTMLNSLTNSLGNTCSPLNLTLPYINKNIQIPCLSAIFAQITGVNGLWSWVGTIASILILYNYLLNLYAWVDRVLTLRAEFDEAMGADLANWGRL